MNVGGSIGVIRRAMSNARGDDLYRARLAFQGMTLNDMQKPHGQSGKSRAEILESYERADDEWCEADAFLRANLPAGYAK